MGAAVAVFTVTGVAVLMGVGVAVFTGTGVATGVGVSVLTTGVEVGEILITCSKQMLFLSLRKYFSGQYWGSLLL